MLGCCCHQDHKKLGKAGDLIDVKAGHARYTLFPHGVADYAVPSVIRDLRVSSKADVCYLWNMQVALVV